MWRTPKTNWVKTDRFNVSDYTRIKDNLLHVMEIASGLALPYSSTIPMSDKTVTDFLYADDLNAIEFNLEWINKSVFDIEYGQKQTYYPNGSMIDYNELNRIERVTADMYDKINNILNGRRMLSFNLGGDL